MAALGIKRPLLRVGHALVALSLSVAGAGAADVTWCADTSAEATLTYCGSVCVSGAPCVQFSASGACSNASRNTCESSTASSDCANYQCLDTAYNSAAKKWTLFVKTPASTDQFSGDSESAFPSAAVDAVEGVEFAEAVTAIQITGYDSTNVQKGAVKSVTFEDDVFSTAPVLETLAIENVNLATLPTGFLPSTVSTLILKNCRLSSLPTQLGSLSNLVNLQLSKNYLTSITDDDATVTAVLEQLTYVDLSSNALTTLDVVLSAVTSLNLASNAFTTFPTAIFNMSQLTSLNMDGNSISNAVMTQSQFNFLKRLSSNSTLGIVSSSGSCGSDTTEDEVLGAVVCISTSTGAAASDDSSGGSSNTLVIVIVVLAAVIVLGLIGGFIWYRRKHRARDGNYAISASPDVTPSSITTNSRPGSTNGTGRSGVTGGTGGTGGNRRRSSLADLRRKSTQPSVYSEITKFATNESVQEGQLAPGQALEAIKPSVVRIPTEDINYTRTIAKGAFGEVWLASLGTDLVAVKKLLAVNPTSVGEFISELNLLADLAHPRILALVGACWDDQFTDLQIVLEYMDSGDLLTVLRRHSPTTLTWEGGKATYCIQICEAIYYLHSLQPALIHRDIKSRNILIDERKGAKLSDFGESRERTFAHTMTAGVGTSRWVAPEIILGEDYSELADIYSLGVLLTELDTHLIPYQKLGMDESMIVQQVAVGKLRPKVSDTCPEVIRRLAHECLQFDPSLRPSAARVLQTLMASPLVRRQPTLLATE